MKNDMKNPLEWEIKSILSKVIDNIEWKTE